MSTLALTFTPSSQALEVFSDQTQIDSCETFCVKSIETLNTANQVTSIKIVAINQLAVSADLALSVTITSATATAVKETLPAQSAFVVYKGNTLDSSAQPTYKFTYDFFPGTAGAVHDNNVVYDLPWEAGKKHKALNGDGNYFKFSMSALSTIVAARAGKIVGIKDNKSIPALSTTLPHSANEILILHTDKTIGIYQNIAQNGALVKVGDDIVQGQKIALSGQTGDPLNPTFTFYVTSPPVADTSDKININFLTSEGVRSYFVKDEEYTAVHTSTNINPDLSFEQDGKTPELDKTGNVSVDTNQNTGSNTDATTNNSTPTNTGSTSKDVSTDSATSSTGNATSGGGGGGGTTSFPILAMLSTLLFFRKK